LIKIIKMEQVDLPITSFETTKLLNSFGLISDKNYHYYTYKGEYRGDVIELVKAVVSKDKKEIKKKANINGFHLHDVISLLVEKYGVYITAQIDLEKKKYYPTINSEKLECYYDDYIKAINIGIEAFLKTKIV